ncbi:hypothetical protein D3C80_1894110 [compost metagenome]
MNLGQTREAGDILINLRIIFHRTGAERVEAVVDAEVAAGKCSIVADDIYFGYFRQYNWLAAQQSGRNQRLHRFIFGNIAYRQGIG